MVITISRQSATNGLFVAQLVAEHLNYRIYDSAIVDEIARRSQVDPKILENFDEVPTSPIASILWEWRSSINPETYARYVRDAIKALAREGNALIVGRGGNFVLHGPNYLNVRMVAPFDLRVSMYIAGEKVSKNEATKWVKTQDERRAEYIRRYYGHSIDDPICYDIIINLAGFSLETAADLIIDATKKRAKEQLSEEEVLPNYIELLARHRTVHQPMIVEPAKSPERRRRR